MATKPNDKITVSWHSGITNTRVTEKFDTDKGADEMVELLKSGLGKSGLRASEVRVNGKAVQK